MATHREARDAREAGEDLESALAECLAHDGPFFLDVRVAAQENCFPMMPSGLGHHRVMLAKDRWYEALPAPVPGERE